MRYKKGLMSEAGWQIMKDTALRTEGVEYVKSKLNEKLKSMLDDVDKEKHAHAMKFVTTLNAESKIRAIGLEMRSNTIKNILKFINEIKCPES